MRTDIERLADDFDTMADAAATSGLVVLTRARCARLAAVLRNAAEGGEPAASSEPAGGGEVLHIDELRPARGNHD